VLERPLDPVIPLDRGVVRAAPHLWQYAEPPMSTLPQLAQFFAPLPALFCFTLSMILNMTGAGVGTMIYT
jgi:hypothetical protein